VEEERTEGKGQSLSATPRWRIMLAMPVRRIEFLFTKTLTESQRLPDAMEVARGRATLLAGLALWLRQALEVS